MIDLTFDKAIEECNGYEKNLLLGNGFSRTYDDAAFNYKHLLKNSQLPQKIKSLFDFFETDDYERVIKKLETLAEIFNNKCVEKEFIDSAERIRDDLIEILSNKHPNSQYEIEPERKVATLNFLSLFTNIFTVNYDLLLYWLVIFNIKDNNKFGEI